MYQHTPGASRNNAFAWNDGSLSIFATDTHFCPLGMQRKSRAALATQAAAKYEAETGKSRGTIRGLSAAAEKNLRTRQPA